MGFKVSIEERVRDLGYLRRVFSAISSWRAVASMVWGLRLRGLGFRYSIRWLVAKPGEPPKHLCIHRGFHEP